MKNCDVYKITLRPNNASSAMLDAVKKWLGRDARDGILGKVQTLPNGCRHFEVRGVSTDIGERGINLEDTLLHILFDTFNFDSNPSSLQIARNDYASFVDFANLFIVQKVEKSAGNLE